jgi:uncharacterized membrane protein YsdA (DUF1294 family)
MLKFVVIMVALINLATFATYGIDKYRSKSNKRGVKRIPERILLSMAAGGGSIGALLAMQLFSHKTQHAKFKYGVPALLLLHAILIIYILLKLYE